MNIEFTNGRSAPIPAGTTWLGGYNTSPSYGPGLEVQAEPKMMVEQLLQMLEELSGQKRHEVREFGVSSPA